VIHSLRLKKLKFQRAADSKGSHLLRSSQRPGIQVSPIGSGRYKTAGRKNTAGAGASFHQNGKESPSVTATAAVDGAG